MALHCRKSCRSAEKHAAAQKIARRPPSDGKAHPSDGKAQAQGVVNFCVATTPPMEKLTPPMEKLRAVDKIYEKLSLPD